MSTLSLASSIISSLKRRKQSSMERYITLLRSSKSTPEQIAEAADMAGVSPEQIQSDVAVLTRARELTDQAKGLNDILKGKAAATAKAEALVEKIEKVTKPLQDELFNVNVEAEQLARQEAQARSALGGLQGLYSANPALLPVADAPAVLKEQIKADQSMQTEGDRRNAARLALEQAERKVGQLRIDVRNLGEVFPQPLNAPIFDVEEERRTRPDRLKAAMAELEAAQEDLAVKQDAYQQIQQAAN